MAKDVRTPIVDPPASAKDAYPISGLTYLLVPKSGKSPERQQIVTQFVQYILTDGQNTAEGMHYAKLPQSLAEQDQKLLSEIQAGAQQTSSSQR